MANDSIGWPDATTLGAARMVLAVASFLAPVAVVRAFGADTATASRVTWLTRMLAVRDGALAAGTARAGSDSSAWLIGGGVSDAVDAVVVFGGYRSGRLRGALPVVLAAGGVASAAVHVVAAARFRRQG